MVLFLDETRFGKQALLPSSGRGWRLGPSIHPMDRNRVCLSKFVFFLFKKTRRWRKSKYVTVYPFEAEACPSNVGRLNSCLIWWPRVVCNEKLWKETNQGNISFEIRRRKFR
jgi:hypothetical protein